MSQARFTPESNENEGVEALSDHLLRPSHDTQTPAPIRLLSQAGASFAILPAPSLVDSNYPATHVVDIELLEPDRLVRYLGRSLSANTLQLLADAWMQAAQDEYPEQTVATVQDGRAGLAVVVIESTTFEVTLEFLIVTDPESDIPEQDGVAFDVTRTELIDAAHAIGRWLA